MLNYNTIRFTPSATRAWGLWGPKAFGLGAYLDLWGLLVTRGLDLEPSILGTFALDIPGLLGVALDVPELELDPGPLMGIWEYLF